MKRVLVVGTSGVGKTTLARALGKATKLPVHHLDKLGWQAGWVRRPQPDFLSDVDALMAKPAWIIEGNYIAALPNRARKADTLILIDLPLWLCVVRVFGRWWNNRGRSRPDLPAGCIEPLPWTFLKWVLSAPPSHQKIWLDVAAQNPHLKFIHLTNPRQVNDFVKGLTHDQTA